MISSCEKASQWPWALFLLSALPARRFEANVITVSSAISACQRASQWERALLLVTSLPDRRLLGNAVAYNAVPRSS